MKEMKNGGQPALIDVVIVGAGAAGLSAALFLVRARRTTVVFDAGPKRILSTEKIHELIGYEHLPPQEFLTAGEREIVKYGGEIRREIVVNIEVDDAHLFTVHSDSGVVRAKAVIIATGLKDVLPDIPGLKEGWGTDIHICPCFTGYELHNKRIVVFGIHERIGQLSKFLTAWSDNVTVLTGQDFDPVTQAKLDTVGVRVVRSEAVAVVRNDGTLSAVLIADGQELGCDAVFVSTPMQAASGLAGALCDIDKDGFAITDEFGKTSRQGLWVIGNANDPIGHLAHAIAAGTKVGPMVTDYLIEQFIIHHNVQ